jgi:hypothetical protein
VLPVVPVRPKRIDDYAEAAGRKAVDRVCRAAEPLGEGARSVVRQRFLTTRELEDHLQRRLAA